jgi:hypothetical protein
MKFRMLLSLLAATCTVLFVAPLAQGAPPRTSDVFRDVPVKGTTPLGGSLTGDFDVQRFVRQGNLLVAQGVLNGTLTEAGVTREVKNVPVALPLALKQAGAMSPLARQQARATCRILHLVLGPLDLDLLGLRVQLNRVVLDITARSGPGRLLGNLLCGIAGLLDRSPIPLGTLQNRLNSLLNVSQIVTNVPLKGALSGNRTFAGTLDITRFSTRNNRLVANGLMSGVVRDAAGNATQNITNAPVSIPVAQQVGTCRILHLTLGPLDLDLLGLEIHLSRVVLDITARRGPGRLLGNLLCAIAGLLDRRPPPLGAVSQSLNRLIVTRPV